MHPYFPDRPFILAVAGGTASGKSTFSQNLQKVAPSGFVRILLTDAYYRSQDHLPTAEREKTNYDHPDALELDLFEQHLTELRAGRAVQVPCYDFSTHTRSQNTETVSPAAIILVEGILVLHKPTVRQLVDYSIFIDAPESVRFSRRLARDVRERGRTETSVMNQWNATVKPMHQEFCEPTKMMAHAILDGTQLGEQLVHSVLKRCSSR